MVANIIAEQLAPLLESQAQFLSRQEARDERMMSMIERLVDSRHEDSARLARIEARLLRVESRCAWEHGEIPTQIRKPDDDPTPGT